jgi:hypothetical protein
VNKKVNLNFFKEEAMLERFSKLGLLLGLVVVLGLMGCPPAGDDKTTETYPPFDFELTGQGWLTQSNAGYQGFSACASSTEKAKTGGSSLRAECAPMVGGNANTQTGELWVPLSPVVNLTGKTLSCYIYAQADSMSAQICAKDSTGWSWSGLPNAALTKDAWTYLSGTLPIVTDFDITQIQAVCVQVHIATGVTCSLPLYLDSYNWQ